jgi:hypothetical protein
MVRAAVASGATLVTGAATGKHADPMNGYTGFTAERHRITTASRGCPQTAR